MAKCVFCSQELETGELFHESEICRAERGKVVDSLEKEDRIAVGLATCGISAGARESLNVLSSAGLSMPVEDVGCSGMCYNEPIVTVRQKGRYSIYANLTKDKAGELCQAIREGRRLDECFIGERLSDIHYFKDQVRIIMKRCGIISPLCLRQYIATTGYDGLKKALKMKPEDVIETVKASGLRGRGGAGFLTGLKWSLLAARKGDKYLIMNGDEGDPGAFMNRTVMESDPFQLIEGLTVAAYATGAKKGIIYTRAEYPLAVETLYKALDIARQNCLLGKDILGIKGFSFDIEMKIGAGAFVCGEETSLMKSVEGYRGHPMPRPPYPAEKGVFGYPTNINNVESYCHTTHVLSMGAESYKTIGSPNNTGTKCICLTGKIKLSGVVEIPLGITLRKLLFEIGGGIKNDRKFKAVQSGGPSGGCIVESELDTPLDFDHVPKLGTIMGSGGLVVMDEDDCMVSVSKFFLTFTTDESCGKCVPCREGTKRMLEIVERISKGNAKVEDIEKLRNLAAVIRDTSLCGLGQTAPNPVLSTLDKFRSEYMAHITEKRCPTGICEGLVKYVITEKCVGCSNCARNCPAGAIAGEPRKKFVIDQNKCTRCGNCCRICAFKAIIRE